MSSFGKTVLFKRFLLCALVVFFLGGCARLPQSGMVNYAPIDHKVVSHVGLAAEGPTVDATPVQLVRDFLRACAAGYTDDFAVARSYLGPPTAISWHPGASVQIFATDSSLLFSSKSDGTVLVRGQAVGSVDELGHYTVAGPATEIQATFSLARGVDNQWRITALDNGIILSAAAFQTAYDGAEVNFLSPDGAALVPTLRWFPRRRQVTYLAKAMLQGPDDDLKGAAISAFPAGTSLSTAALDVTDGVASIPLVVPGGLPDATTVDRMYWQMETTLQSVGEASSVKLFSGYVLLNKGSVPIQPASPRPSAVLVKDGQIQSLVQGKVSPLLSSREFLGSQIGPVAVSNDGSLLFYVQGNSRLFVSRNRGQSTLLLEGQFLRSLSVDRLNWIWVSDDAAPGQIIAISPTAQVVRLNPLWLQGEKILAWRISPDGAKAAFLVQNKEKEDVSLRWAHVKRDASGTPTSLGGLQNLGVDKNTYKSLSWADNTKVLALLQEADKSQVYSFSLSGPTTVWPAVADAVGITALREDKTVLLVTSSGDLFQRSGRNWQQVATEVRFPAYPG